MYIYKLGTECDGAQMRVSDVYIPTLVALLGLCFDPSECFQDLCVWSGVVGNKSGKLRYVLQIMTSTSMNKQNNFHYSKLNNHKNNSKPPMQTNRPPGANDYRKPTAPAANSSYKKDDKGTNTLKPPFCPTVNATTRTIPPQTNLEIPFVIDVGRLGMQMNALITCNEPGPLLWV